MTTVTKTPFKTKTHYDSAYMSDDEHWRPWTMVFPILGIIFFLTGLIVFLVMFIGGTSQHNNGVMCRKWGVATNRPVRFIKYPWYGSDCLTPTPNDPTHWISTGQIQSITINGVTIK